jgi:hypothetical protein
MVGAALAHLRRHGLAYAALFIVLGGTAVALPGKNSVTSDDIAKGAVKSKDLAKKAVKGKHIAKGAVKKGKLAANAVTTSKLANGAVTGPKLAEKAVGREKIADNAVGGAQADEATFQGLVKGDGRLIANALTVPAHGGDFVAPPFPVILEIPGFGRAELITCNGDTQLDRTRVRMISADDATDFLAIGEASAEDLPGGDPADPNFDSSAGFLGGGGGGFLAVAGNAPAIGIAAHFEYQLSRGSGADATGATLEIDVYNDSTNGDPLGACHVAGQAIMHE